MAVNARTEEFQHIEVFDKPALFTNGRIARDTVPKGWYLRRLEEETEPAVRELLERDMAHLDAIQFSSASSRKFVLVIPLTEKMNAEETALRQLEKSICDHGLRVRLAEEQDVKRLLAIYYRQDLTTEVFRDFDGEEYVHG